LALLFDFSNRFHDAANVVATIIATGALSPQKALLMAAICEFIGPFLFGTAVAEPSVGAWPKILLLPGLLPSQRQH
jgi:PiT family inorganic phosphate transporter